MIMQIQIVIANVSHQGTQSQVTNIRICRMNSRYAVCCEQVSNICIGPQDALNKLSELQDSAHKYQQLIQ